MAIISYKNVGIHSLSACVPRKVVQNSELDYLIPKEDLDKTIPASFSHRKHSTPHQAGDSRLHTHRAYPASAS